MKKRYYIKAGIGPYSLYRPLRWSKKRYGKPTNRSLGRWVADFESASRSFNTTLPGASVVWAANVFRCGGNGKPLASYVGDREWPIYGSDLPDSREPKRA